MTLGSTLDGMGRWGMWEVNGRWFREMGHLGGN